MYLTHNIFFNETCSAVLNESLIQQAFQVNAIFLTEVHQFTSTAPLTIQFIPKII